MKYILFMTFIISLSFVSCGNKSEIKNAVQARTTAEAYGDGEYVIRPVILPLSDQELSSYDSPTANIGLIFGGFAKLFMDLGATLGMGKTQISVIQPVPEIPSEYLKELRVKRIFFYIEPKKEGQRSVSWWQRILKGRGDVNFKFLNKVAVKLSTQKLSKIDNWSPTVNVKGLSASEFSPIYDLFKRNDDVYRQVIDSKEVRDLVILKYDRKDRDRYLKNDEYGKVYIINTKNPAKTKKFFQDESRLNDLFNRIHILNNSILVELKKDSMVEEKLEVIFSDYANEFEELGITLVEACTRKTCMDLKVQNVNLLPLIAKGNAIKLDAFINAGKVPESFKLKGFIEFEVKLKLSF